MKKAELKDVATRYGMGIIREEVTSKGVGLFLVTEEDIPELDALANIPPNPQGRRSRAAGASPATRKGGRSWAAHNNGRNRNLKNWTKPVFPAP